MRKKMLIVGAVFAAFLMLMIPNISAVNEQVKEENINLNLMNTLENLQTTGLLKDIFWIISGLLFIVIGTIYNILAVTGIASVMSSFGIISLSLGIVNIIFSILGRNNPLEIILDGISGSVGGFLFAIFCGVFYYRCGIYMMINKEIPDEETIEKWPFFNFILKLMTSGEDI